MTNKALTWIYFPESMCLPQLKSMCLPQLKSLCLRSITITNIDSANELFKSCPGLETLVLSNIDVHVEDDEQNFVINNALLQHLEIKNIWYLNFYEDSIVNPKPIQLDVPGLKKFIYEDSVVRENCCFINDSSSLVTADITMILNDTYDENGHGDKVDEDPVLYSNVSEAKKEEFSKRMLKFLRALHCVKELKLSPGFFEVLSRSPNLLDNPPLQFDNLRYLKMELWLTRGCLDVITHLLKISPNVESIYITSKECGLENFNGVWEPELSQPCMLSHLKFIEIGAIQGNDNELKLLGLLLKNAVALEDVKLYFHSNPCSTDQRRRESEFIKKLKALPRASSSINTSFVNPSYQ